MSLAKYASRGEAAAARRIIKGAIERGLSLSVNDGEETTVRRSRNCVELAEALCTTGFDRLVIHNADGTQAGTLLLVWGNADDGSELVADHTANPLCGELAALVERVR